MLRADYPIEYEVEQSLFFTCTWFAMIRAASVRVVFAGGAEDSDESFLRLGSISPHTCVAPAELEGS